MRNWKSTFPGRRRAGNRAPRQARRAGCATPRLGERQAGVDGGLVVGQRQVGPVAIAAAGPAASSPPASRGGASAIAASAQPSPDKFAGAERAGGAGTARPLAATLSDQVVGGDFTGLWSPVSDNGFEMAFENANDELEVLGTDYNFAGEVASPGRAMARPAAPAT